MVKEAIIVEGLNDVLRAIDRVPLKAKAEFLKACADIGNAVERQAMRTAAVGSEPLHRKKRPGNPKRRGGQFKQSITHRVFSEKGERGVWVGSNLPYAKYIELGTERIIEANRAPTIKIKGVSGKVLDPTRPLKMWAAQKKRRASGQRMPSIRAAFYKKIGFIKTRLKGLFK